jgi:hypothetical protein
VARKRYHAASDGTLRRSGRPTRYAGVRFRSRLESVWAEALDDAGLRWAYEPQEYVCGNRTYLPDFWLADLDAHAEVKPVEPTMGEYMLGKLLCVQTQRPVYFLVGSPGPGYAACYLPVPDWPGVTFEVLEGFLAREGSE